MKRGLILLVMVCAGSANAVPPPAFQLTADCNAPVYASDSLVCEDPDLQILDALLASSIAERGNTDSAPEEQGDDEDWFRRSRLCAFEPDHRDCLVSAYCLRLALVADPGLLIGTECVVPDSDYIAASTISKSGFARKEAASDLNREIMLSGFVDHQNLFGDESARKLLGERWGGYGPDALTWQFNLKAKKDDPPGQSFAILVPNDILRDDLLRIFLRDARERSPTRVYLKGLISTFYAPINASTLHGLRVEVRATRDIRPDSQVPE